MKSTGLTLVLSTLTAALIALDLSGAQPAIAVGVMGPAAIAGPTGLKRPPAPMVAPLESARQAPVIRPRQLTNVEPAEGEAAEEAEPELFNAFHVTQAPAAPATRKAAARLRYD